MTRMLAVPADPREPVRRVHTDDGEGHQVTRMQQIVGGVMDAARVAVIVDQWDDGATQERWVHAFVHDTGLLDGLPLNARLWAAFGLELFGDAVLTAADASDGSSRDLPASIEAIFGEPVDEE